MPHTLTPRAAALIRYALTRQMNWISSPACPFTQPTCREIYTRSAHARNLLDAAKPNKPTKGTHK